MTGHMGKLHTTEHNQPQRGHVGQARATPPARLKLEKMLHQGLCLGRSDEGTIALVSGGIPGEKVQAQLQKRAGVLQGKVIEVLEPAPSRVTTPVHSGLDYGHIAYNYQRVLKQSVIVDAYTRACQQHKHTNASAALRKMPGEIAESIVASPQLWHYRYTVQPAVQTDAHVNQLGYRLAHSHEIQVLDSDPTAHASINQLWQQLHTQNIPKGIQEIVLRCNDAEQVLLALIARASTRNYLGFAHHLLEHPHVAGVSYASYDPRGRFRSGSEKLAGKRSILQSYGDFAISTTTSSFAQPNPSAASLLYQEIQNWVGTLTGIEHALDLYAGSGIIAMHLLKHVPHVTALEIDGGAVARGKRDAQRLGLELNFIKGNAKKLPQLSPAQLICVDPPRAGLAKSTRDAIVASQAAFLIYVSCDVATWARDVVDLQARGFTLRKVQGYDFYPHTHHIEVLSLLERGQAR